MQRVGGKDVLKYTLLPGIFPRTKELLGSGFSNVAYLIAVIYQAVRLLPKGHPYLNPENFGRFGIRHVIAAAANNLKFSWKNIDQILVFFVLLVGLVMLIMQVLLYCVSLFILPALAAMPATPIEFFITQLPEQDIAFILMDKIFGVPGLFNSCISTGVSCEDTAGRALPTAVVGFYPTPYQVGMHALLQMYNVGIFLIGVIIIIYFSISVTAETAVSGTPFGKRFNHLWAPIRLMFFFFLIAPILFGMNAAQLTVLYAAKWGSGLATNGWLLFNEEIRTANTTPFGDEHSLLAHPNTPEPGAILQFITTVTTCKYAHTMIREDDGTAITRNIQPYLVRKDATTIKQSGGGGNVNSNVLLVRMGPPGAPPPVPLAPHGNAGFNSTSFEEALQFYENGDIVIRYGEYSPDLYPDQAGNVYPWCGELVIPNPGVALPLDGNGNMHIPVADNENYAMMYMYKTWYLLFAGVLWDEGGGNPTVVHEWGNSIARNIITPHLQPPPDPIPTTEDFQNLVLEFKYYLNNAIHGPGGAIDGQNSNNTYAMTDEVLRKGWAGAAIWYNKIAEMNGGFFHAVFGAPRPRMWPDAMEQVLEIKRKNDSDVEGPERFDPRLSNGQIVRLKKTYEVEIARACYMAFKLWVDSGVNLTSYNVTGMGNRTDFAGAQAGEQLRQTNNILIDAINAIFGTSGLFEMRANTDVHPLAQLTGIGKSMVHNAITAFGFAAGATIGLGLGGMMQKWIGALAGPASGMAISVGTAGLMVGVILYYVLPFMPFVYFFFAVGGWIKAIFEAMLGVPLWALAHLRIDGEGLPGRAAMNGYFLIFEIFLRPFLIVVGFLGSIVILTAQVKVLNEIFDLVVVNVAGRDTYPDNLDPADFEYYRQAIDEFFYTIIYAVIVYMMALSSFKLIDLVPNQITRWLGASVQAFGESEKDPAGNLLSTTSYGATAIGTQMGQAGSMARGAFLGQVLGGK